MVFDNLVCAVLGEEIPVSKEFIPKLLLGFLVDFNWIQVFNRKIPSCKERSGREAPWEEVHEARGEKGTPEASLQVSSEEIVKQDLTTRTNHGQ